MLRRYLTAAINYHCVEDGPPVVGSLVTRMRLVICMGKCRMTWTFCLYIQISTSLVVEELGPN